MGLVGRRVKGVGYKKKRGEDYEKEVEGLRDKMEKEVGCELVSEERIKEHVDLMRGFER